MSGSTETIEVCPKCEYSRFRVRGVGINSTAKGARYKCVDCAHEFDEPKIRTRNQPHTNLSGLAAQLDEMDPEVV